MPLRERVRKALGRPPSTAENGSSGGSGSFLKRITSRAEKEEPMPRPKYVSPYNKEHHDKLRAFTFAGAFNRRNSDQGQYSPFGSRLPSPRPSPRPSIKGGRRSLIMPRRSLNAEQVAELRQEKSNEPNAQSAGTSADAAIPIRSEEPRATSHGPTTSENSQMGQAQQRTGSNNEQPFSGEELNSALKNANVLAAGGTGANL